MAFWGKKTADPPTIGCYGKLPATGDFIRMNNQGSEYQSFDQWLSGSLACARQRLDNHWADVFAPGLGVFIYRGKDGDGGDERGLVGCWAASGDSAGRRYPMMVAASYDYQEMAAVGAALPIAVWPFITAAYDLVANGRNLPVDQFLARASQLRPVSLGDVAAAKAPFENWLAQSTAGDFWTSTFGSAEPRHHVVYTLKASLDILRGHERPATNMALRLPLGLTDAYGVGVWMAMTAKLAGWQQNFPNVFWTPQHDVVVHPGPPHVETFQELIAYGASADNVTGLLGEVPAESASRRRELGALAPLIDDLGASLQTVLAGIG